MNYQTCIESEEDFLNLLQEPAIAEPKKESVNKYVDLLSDIGFKHVFGREANKEILIVFLNEVLPDRKISDIEHIRNEQIPLNRKKKKSIYDLYCKTDDGSRIIVEVQQEQQDDYVDRTLYYTTFAIQNQIERGTEDYTICPIYSVSILNKGLRELKGTKDVLSVFRIKGLAQDIVLSNKYTLIFIELNKFNKKLGQIAQDNILERFYYCLKHMAYLNERPLVLQQEIFAKLFEAAQIAEMPEEEQEEYFAQMITERDRKSQMKTATRIGMEKGMKKGMKKGMEKAIIETARKFKEQNVAIDIIAACTGLSVEQISGL